MKTSHLLIASIALLLGLTAATTRAGLPDSALTLWVSSAGVGQNTPSASSDVDDLLRRARKAMKDGDLKTADTLISQAEKMGGTQGLFKFDNPRRLARTWKSCRPRSNNPRSLASDSHRSATTPTITTLATGLTRSPVMGLHRPVCRSATAGADPEIKSKAAAFLQNARYELAQNNLTGAAQWCRQAADLHAQFDTKEDSPEKLQAEIVRRGGNVDLASHPAGASGVAGLGSSSADRAPRTLPQVEDGLSPKNIPASSSAPANSSAGLSPFGRSMATSTPIEVLPEDNQQRLPGPNGGGVVSGETRTQCDALLLGARRSLAVGDVRRASEAVQQAKAMQVNYGLLDDSPAKVETLIQKYSDVVSRQTGKETEAYRHQYADVLSSRPRVCAVRAISTKPSDWQPMPPSNARCLVRSKPNRKTCWNALRPNVGN